MLIDSHAHLGTCRVFGASQTADDLLGAMDASGVDVAIVQPFPGAPDPAAVHDDIAALGGRTDGRVRGLVSLNPHQDRDVYRAEVARCVEDLGFVGVKIHPLGHAVKPGSDDAQMVAEVAVELGVALMIHTGPGIPFADPAGWLYMAQAHPELTIVYAHAGAGLHTGSAITCAKQSENIYLETSWCNPQDIRAAVNALGPHRVMFGSDMLFNIEVERTKYEVMGFDDEAALALMADNAARVFGLDVAGA